MGLPQYKEDDHKITPSQHQEFVRNFLSAGNTTKEMPKVIIQDGANRIIVYKDAVAVHYPPFEPEPSNA